MPYSKTCLLTDFGEGVREIERAPIFEKVLNLGPTAITQEVFFLLSLFTLCTFLSLPSFL
jgi:hypothetical protein